MAHYTRRYGISGTDLHQVDIYEWFDLKSIERYCHRKLPEWGFPRMRATTHDSEVFALGDRPYEDAVYGVRAIIDDLMGDLHSIVANNEWQSISEEDPVRDV
jgi:hypothetical protein